MKNYLIFLLMLISLSVHARANWNPYSMTHERFVHLSESDKRAVIIATMELIVELESKYQKEIVSSGFSTERFQKFVQVLNKFQNLIIGSANAAGTSAALTQLAGQFSDLLKSLGSDGCLYAGYVSKMKTTKNGTKYCRHPSMMDSNIPEEEAIKKAYLTRGNTCIGPKKISCNPVVFGYQDIEGTKPICVETGWGLAHNASYNCMKKALAEPDKDARLLVLTKAMSENKDAFNKVHSFIFKTCVCGESTLNKDYVEYMKPHRTCYGLMNTLRVVSNNECEQLTKIQPATEFANDWNNYFGKAGVYPELDPERSGAFDKVYRDLINQKSVQAICEPSVPVITKPTDPVIEDPQDPVVIIKPQPENKTWFCETKCTKQDAIVPELPKIKCIVQNAGFLKDKEERKPANVEELKALLVSEEIIVDDAEAKTVSIELKDKTKQECPVTMEEKEKDPEAAPTCSIALVDDEKDPTKSKATVTFTGLKEKEEAIATWTGGTPTAELPNEVIVTKVKGAVTPLKVVFTIKDAPVVEGAPEMSCPAEVAALPEDEDPATPAYTIQATAEKALDTTVKVNAKITIDGKEAEVPAGFKISWSRKGSGVAKLLKVEPKTVTTSGVKDTSTDGTEVATEAPKVTEGEVGIGPSITELRVAEAYETGATLYNDKGVVVAGPSFATIPKLDTPKQNPYQNFQNQNNQQQPPPFFFFNGQNTATQGF